MKPSYSSAKKASFKKDHIDAILLYESCPCDMIKYSDKDKTYYIFDSSYFSSNARVIEAIKVFNSDFTYNDNVFIDVKNAIRDKNLSSHLYLDPTTHEIMEEAKVVIYVNSKSDFPSLDIYASTYELAVSKYNELLGQLKDSSDYIEIIC